MGDDSPERLSQQVAELRTDLLEHINQLQNAIAELRESVAVHFRAGERIERARTEVDRGAAAERAGRAQTLAEQVAALAHQMQQLNARVAVLERKG